MTLEDVWHILRIPIHGELVVYDPAIGQTTLHQLCGCGDEELGIRDYEIGWDLLVAQHEQLIAMICWVIDRLLIPDRWGHGFPIRWD